MKKLKIDNKDKQILYELYKNCRQNLSELAKKLRTRENVIAYRINKLEKHKVIRGYYTLIDTFLLGYQSFRVYFNFQNLTKEIKKSIIDFFVKNELTYFVSTIEGRFDFVVALWVKEINELYSFFETIMRKYRKYILNYLVTPIQFTLFDVNFLEGNEKAELNFKQKEKIDIDKIDYKILKFISYNARASFVEIADKLNIGIDKVKYRIKKLVKKKIIKGFRADINFWKLGYKWFKVNIWLNDYNKYKEIEKFIRQNPNLSVINYSIGLADLEPEFFFKTTEELENFMEELQGRFRGEIKNYSYFYPKKILKINFIPHIQF